MGVATSWLEPFVSDWVEEGDMDLVTEDVPVDDGLASEVVSGPEQDCG